MRNRMNLAIRLWPFVLGESYPTHSGRTKLHVFVDACSVEVFINDGEQVFTALAYPSANSRGVEFFGQESALDIKTLDVWTLKSVWN
jgi:sucrose-6-phosphate hydrolase SacC (GH32 family)